MLVTVLLFLQRHERIRPIQMTAAYSSLTATSEILVILMHSGSFLLSIHEKRSLAAAIVYNFEKLAQGAPEGRAVGPTPGQDGIFGFLQACEDQTSSFNWQNILLAVGATLGSSEAETYVCSIPYLSEHFKAFRYKNEHESNN